MRYVLDWFQHDSWGLARRLRGEKHAQCRSAGLRIRVQSPDSIVERENSDPTHTLLRVSPPVSAPRLPQ